MTKSDVKRIDAFRSIDCICTAIRGGFNPNYDVHHIVDKGYRRLSGGHAATIPLGIWYHRGIHLDGWSTAEMIESFGPSLALSKREFIKTFGTERELLAIVDSRLEYLNAQKLFNQEKDVEKAKPIYRQGDCMLLGVDEIPADAKASKKSKKLVLLEGEATGHFHQFQDAQDVRMYSAGGDRYIDVGALALLTHEEHDTVSVPAGKYFIPMQVEWTDENEPRVVAD